MSLLSRALRHVPPLAACAASLFSFPAGAVPSGPDGAVARAPRSAPPAVFRVAAGEACADAAAHFQIAREIGTREALALHATLFPDCPFAPLARMLMDKLPGGDTTAAPEVPAADAAAPAVPPAADATRLADALTERLTEWQDLIPAQASISYESASLAGEDLTIVGLQLRDQDHHGGGVVAQSRWRFDETVLSHPVLGDDGTLSADRIAFNGGKTEDRGVDPGGWVDALNRDKGQFLSGSLVLDAPRFIASSQAAPDALAGRLQFAAVTLDTARLRYAGQDVLTVSGIAGKAREIAEGVPTQLTLTVADVSVGAAMATEMSGIDLSAAGYPTFSLGFVADLSADRGKGSLDVKELQLELKDGAKISVAAGVQGVDAIALARQFFGGGSMAAALDGKAALASATVSIEDEGLTAKLVTLAAGRQGMDPAVMKGVAAFQLQSALQSLTGDSAVAEKAFQAALAYLSAPKSIVISFSPAVPLPLADLMGVAKRSAGLAVLRDSAPSVVVNDLAPITLFPAAPAAKGGGPDAPQVSDSGTCGPLATGSCALSPTASTDDTLPPGWSYDLVPGHTSGVTALAYSADGTLVATGSDDDTVKIWSASTGALLRTLGGHAQAVTALSFGATANLLASGSDDATVRLWDAETGELKRTLASGDLGVNAVAVSPDGLSVAAGSYQKIEIWDAATGALQRTIPAHESNLNALAFTPDSARIASASFDRTAKIWDARTGTLLRTLPAASDSVTGLAFAAGGKVLATASGKVITLWNAENGSKLKTLEGHLYGIFQLAASPDGKSIASAGGVDATIKLWDVASGAMTRSMDITGYANAVAFGPDGRTLAAGSSFDAAVLLDAKAGSPLRTLSSGAVRTASVDFGVAATLVTASLLDNGVNLWNDETGTLIKALSAGSYMTARAVSPDGTVVVDANYSGIDLWNGTTGDSLGKWPAQDGRITSAAVSPDNRLVAFGSDGGDIALRSVEDGALVRTLKGHAGTVHALAFSRDGTVLASGGDDKTLRLWDAATGTLTETLDVQTHSVDALALTPDGATVASGSQGPVKLWDTGSGMQTQSIEAVTSIVKALQFAPDGKTIAVAVFDEPAFKLFDAATGQLVREFAGHTGGLDDIAISADGRLAASTSEDRTVRLWDFASGEQLASFVAYPGGAAASVFGGRLWTSSKAAERFISVRRPDGLQMPLTEYRKSPAG